VTAPLVALFIPLALTATTHDCQTGIKNTFSLQKIQLRTSSFVPTQKTWKPSLRRARYNKQTLSKIRYQNIMATFTDEMLYHYVLSLLNIPYKWAGRSPMEGLDCSGLVLLILQSCGVVPRGTDLSAQGLFDYLTSGRGILSINPGFGTLVFFGKSTKEITHVGFAIDTWRMIEAGGGDHLILTKDDAIAKAAFTRISPIAYRKDKVAMVMPSYVSIGGT
jgi:cell wall-associated NlpC family hydrolase